MRKVLLLFLILLVFLTACQDATPEPVSTPTVAPAVQVQSPGAQSPGLPSGPTPTVITTIPAPEADTGVVTGVVFSTKMDAPLSQIGVYLGEFMYLTPGPDYMITMREQGSPHTMADSNGRFVISDVQPGEYPQLLWTPFNSYVIPDKEGEKELLIKVEPGKVVDLGEIRVEWP